MTREEAIAYGKRVIDLGLNDETQAFCELAIKALEQQSSEDCVSRKAVLSIIKSICFSEEYLQFRVDRGSNGQRDAVINCIKALPSATPQPKTGHWIYFKAVNTGEIIWSKCSKCGNEERGCAQRMKYCPECGARMEAKE